MSKIKLIITVLLFPFISYSQEEIQQDLITSTVYMIDESWKPNSNILWPTEGNTSYVQIIPGDYFVISYRIRGRDYYYEGEIKDWVGDEYELNFWVRGRDLSGGKPVLSFSLIYDIDRKHVHMHLFNTLGRFDNYYSGHLASEEEIQNLLKYDEKN